MKKTIEQRTADTILQRPREVLIGDKTYSAAPPTTATLILVSELVATMPSIKLDPENIVAESLMIAKDCRAIGAMASVLILGEGNLTRIERTKKTGIPGLLGQYEDRTIDAQAELASAILQNLSPKQLNDTIVELLKGMEIADFFGLSTSLIEINLTRATRGVEQMTASGQQ